MGPGSKGLFRKTLRLIASLDMVLPVILAASKCHETQEGDKKRVHGSYVEGAEACMLLKLTVSAAAATFDNTEA